MLRTGLRVSIFLSALIARSAFAAGTPVAPTPALPEVVSFNRHIRPIMSDTCFLCHGNDAKSRKAGMRLDIREEALKPTKHDVIPIVPGKPEESEIIFRINDTVEPMPPEDAHKTLTAYQKAVIRRWVEQGAVYESHWAYAPLTKPAVPAKGAVNPIDAFIREKLAKKKISSSPEAAKSRLLRRLSLDLTGLPPTPEEVAAFVADASPGAYERQVDRLLASKHHGERMAVWWLDVARFADTVGFHGDQNQRIFPYRDYVINAFNANKRFDQFTIEQLAGDLLPNPTPEQRVATGYNRLNMMTREGGAQPKEYLAKYGAERVRSVAAAWFGSTFGCAECHDHKFDPIKTRDFYELQSFFADVKQWGVYADYKYTQNPDLAGFNNDYPFPPEIEVESPYLAQRKERTEQELRAHLASMREKLRDEKISGEFERWVADARTFLASAPGGWQQPPVAAALLKGGKPTAKGEVPVGEMQTVAVGRNFAKDESLRLTMQPGAGRIAAVRLDVENADTAAPMKTKAAARTAMRIALSKRTAAGETQKLAVSFADATEKETRYDGGAEVIGIASGWKLPADTLGRRITGVWLLETPESFEAEDQLVVTVTGEAASSLQVFTSPFAAANPLEIAAPAWRDALAATAQKRSGKQHELLIETWLLSTAADRAALARCQELMAKLRDLRDGRAWSMVTEAVEPMALRILPRGNWQDETGPVVLPATPSFLPGRIESTAEKRLTRLDLARWIVSRENPITARTVVNRLWQIYFGTGLSAVLDDLGSQGEPPSHPELLEWLAGEFRDHGWNLRHVIRLIVTSATYRQSSSLRPELREIDPANRLLASQNPRRLEAEFVRDNALAIAGALNLSAIGGPSVKPYQPPGYYAAIQFPNRDYMASEGDEQWRRGVYMHWQRTFLHPMLANFDAPGRDECAAQRVVSNTPQQALTLLNDPTFVEAARLFAARLMGSATADETRMRRAYQIALARDPNARELASLQSFLAKQREYYRANESDAEKLLGIGLAPAPAGDRAELAAWTNLCRVVLNLQEVITRY